MDTEAALWASVGEMPQDRLRRGVLADWYDERGRHDEADALRATADRVPYPVKPFDSRTSDLFWWFLDYTDGGPMNGVSIKIHRELTGRNHGQCRDYPTAEAAIRDLVRAWVAVHRQGVPA